MFNFFKVLLKFPRTNRPAVQLLNQYIFFTSVSAWRHSNSPILIQID